MTQISAIPDRPILIIGAGLSGLATARLLTNHGIPNIVFEASAPDRSQGFAISLQEFGYTPLLSALGGLPLRSLTRGVAPDRETGGTGWIDQSLWDNSTAEMLLAPEPSTKQEIVRVNRNALREWIADSGDSDVDVRYWHRLKQVHDGSLGDVTVEFENGATYRGVMVVAADGVNSTVRSHVLPSVTPETLPAVLYHGEFHLPRADFDRLFRPLTGKSNILAGVGDRFNAPFAVCNMTKTDVHMDWSYSRPVVGSCDEDPLYRPNLPVEEAKTVPSELFEELASRNLAEPWSVILNEDAIRSHRVFHWTVRCVFVNRGDVDRAASRGVVFVGDSWHAMPIFGGEGGNHALVDGVELVEALAGKQSLNEAISQYYDRSLKRSQEAVRRSRQRFYALHRPIAEWREISDRKKKMKTG